MENPKVPLGSDELLGRRKFCFTLTTNRFIVVDRLVFRCNTLVLLSWECQKWGGFGGKVALPKPGVSTPVGATVIAPRQPEGVSSRD